MFYTDKKKTFWSKCYGTFIKDMINLSIKETMCSGMKYQEAGMEIIYSNLMNESKCFVKAIFYSYYFYELAIIAADIDLTFVSCCHI